LNTETIQIPDLVRGMSDMLQRSLGPSILIETHFPLKLSPIAADANQLEMALLNLAVNARDAMPEGGQIVIAAQEEKVSASDDGNLKPGRYVRLSVTDTGQGMDAETLRRAGEPFFTTKGVGKGTGLGVPMVHGLAEQFGGRFNLRSRLGEGTTAEIWLPAAESAPVPNPARSPDRATERFFEPFVILYVDDDPLVLTNTVAMLEDLGHTAIAASSGRQALDVLRKEDSIDLVITDEIMPGMTGTELAKAIRAEWPEVSTILASGFAETPLDRGRLPRLRKPFSQTELAESISSLPIKVGKKGRLLRLRKNEQPET
jgi:CheY-like chemotaxis protein/anti-sigma regulatory factor (Ser/Thr protein kinase)